MITQITSLTAALKKSGFNAREWKNERIYLNGLGRDITAFVTLDEPLSAPDADNLFEGCGLKVFSNCDNQPMAWKINRAKQVKHEIMKSLDFSGITALSCLKHGPVCETWQEVIL